MKITDLIAQQKQEAIAGWYGWQRRCAADEHDKTVHWHLYDSQGNCIGTGLPNYWEDLNACHTAEHKLSNKQRLKYGELLDGILKREFYDGKTPYIVSFWHASAEHRTEALWLVITAQPATGQSEALQAGKAAAERLQEAFKTATPNPEDVCECRCAFRNHDQLDPEEMGCRLCPCQHFIPKQSDLGKEGQKITWPQGMVKIQYEGIAATPPKISEDEVEKSWSHQIMVEINKLTTDIKGKAFDVGWFLLRQMLEQKDEQTVQLKSENERLTDMELFYKEELDNVKEERESLLLSLAQKDEALKLIRIALEESEPSYATDVAYKLADRAISTPTPDTAILKQFEGMRLTLEEVLHYNIPEFLRDRVVSALNPTKEGEK